MSIVGTSSKQTLKRALVTGASEGIGRAFALRLAADGWTVTGVARNEERLKALVNEMAASSNGCHDYLVADLSDADGELAVIKAIQENDYGLLVNNAGFGNYGKFFEQPVAMLDSMLNVNCRSLLHLSHAYLNVAKPDSSLINVSSGLAFVPFPDGAVYAATKAFVTSLSESLWHEHRSRGIYVLGLCPGVTESKFSERAGGSMHRPPDLLVETAEAVVNTAMNALRKRSRPTVISGLHNKLTIFLVRFLPRKWIILLMGKSPK